MRKHTKFIGLVLLATLILWWFGKGLNWTEVGGAVSRSDKRLLALAFATVGITYLIRAFRWRALLAPLAHASIRELFVATTVGFGAVFIFGRAGEVVRPVVLPMRERRVRPVASFVTIIIERIYDIAAVVVFFAINLIWFRAPAGEAAELRHVREAGLILLGLAALSIGALVLFKRRSSPVIRRIQSRLARWRFFPQRLSVAITGTLEQLATALGILVDLRELAVTVGWTALLWGVITVANWLVLRAFGLPYGPGETIFIMGWALVGSLVPTPGGAAGAFHTAAAAGLIFLGVSRDQAAAVAIVIHLVLFSPALVFGLFYVIRGDISIRRLRELTSPEAVEHAVEDERIRPSKEAAAAS